MANEAPDRGDWQACQPGQLAELAGRLEARTSGARLRRVYGSALLSMLLVAGAVLLLGTMASTEDGPYGSLSCRECQAQFAAYNAHKTGAAEMSSAMLDRVEAHLSKCSGCRGMFNANYPGVLPPDFEVASRSAVQRWRPTFTIAHVPPSF